MTDKLVPLHEALPEMLTDTATKKDFMGFMALLKIIEEVEIPRNHDKILLAIQDGQEILGMEFDTTALGAEATLQVELAEFDEAERNRESADMTSDEEIAKTSKVTVADKIINESTPGYGLEDTSGLSDAP